MKSITYTITEDIFSLFPDYIRGVVVLKDVRNGPSPAELVALLRQAEERVRSEVDPDRVAEHPRITSWREAFRKTGVKPAEFRSSIEAMVRRVVKGNELPSISALVDIGNVLSLRSLVPTGGHSLDDVQGDIALRLATGEETFIPFGEEKEEHPLPGEIIFAEGNTVMTRRWSWRQGVHTLTVPGTKFLEFNVDGLPPVPREEVETVCGEVMDLVSRFCGGTGRYGLLTRATPSMELS